MNKSVLISIRPNWCKEILSGYKTLEIRKTRPKLQTPFKCYIYCTKEKSIGERLWVLDKETRNQFLMCKPAQVFGAKDAAGAWLGNGKIVGEFVCDKIEKIDVPYPAYQKELPERILKESCIPYYDLHRYAYHDDAFGWHISDLKIYDTPKQLADFGLSRPPQSWRYINR